MVLERLISQSDLQKKPVVGALIGLLAVLVGFLSALFIFSSAISVAMIGLSSMLLVPYVMKAVQPDKAEYVSVFSRKNKVIAFYAFLFLGMTVAYLLLFGVLNPLLGDKAFSLQLDAIGVTGRFASPDALTVIVSNNLLIVCVSILLSFFYGTGAIFILNYNASIAGIVYGGTINALIWGGVPLFANPLAYLPHTILEVLAYLLAAICGSLMTKPMRSNKRIPRDAAILLVAAVALILLAGWVEIAVAPVLSSGVGSLS